MFARALLRVARPHVLRAPLAPRSAFLKFCSPTCTHLSRRTGISGSPALSHVALNLKSSPCNFRAFSLLHGCSRPTRPAVSARGFFTSSDGPRPSLAEVLSIAKLKARHRLLPAFFESCFVLVSLRVLQLAHYGTWFVGGTVVLVIVNVILRGMKRCE